MVETALQHHLCSGKFAGGPLVCETQRFPAWWSRRLPHGGRDERRGDGRDGSLLSLGGLGLGCLSPVVAHRVFS